MKNKIKFEELDFFKPVLNWVFFIFLSSIALIIFIYSQRAEFEDPNLKIIFLLIFAIFMILTFQRKKFGIESLPQYYEFLGMKNKELIAGLSFFPLVSYGIYFIVTLFTAGKIILTNMINISLISFSFPIILVFYVFLAELLNKILNKIKRRFKK